MDSNSVIFIVFCVLFHAFKGTVDASRITKENGLKTLLWTTNSYDNSVRPDNIVNVTTNFFPLALRYLDIADGSMGLVGYFTFSWTDSRLDWSSNPTYSSVPLIYTTGKTTWYPPLVVFNSIEEIQILMDSSFQNPIRVISSGDCEFAVVDLMNIDCDTDPTYYPFDTQVCKVVIAAMGYGENEISHQKPQISTDLYNENGEWDFTVNEHYPAYRFTGVYGGDSVQTSARQRGKNGIFTDLAYAVYLTLVSEHLPTVSLNISYISIYLVITLAAGSCVVFFSKLVLSCHHKPEDEPVPQWVINIHEGWMGKFAGIHGTFPCCKSKDNDVVQVSTASEESPKTPCGESSQEKEVTWPDITRFLDKFLFRVFMSLTCIQQFVFFIIFIYGYSSS